MNARTLIAAAMASLFAITAAAPAFSAPDTAKHDPVKREKRINRMIKRTDTNGDGKVSRAEMAAALAATFDVLDRNGDGRLTKSELANRKGVYKAHREQAKASGQRSKRVIRMPKRVEKHFEKIDANHDGAITKVELRQVAERMFLRRDKNGDGYISMADFKR